MTPDTISTRHPSPGGSSLRTRTETSPLPHFRPAQPTSTNLSPAPGATTPKRRIPLRRPPQQNREPNSCRVAFATTIGNLRQKQLNFPDSHEGLSLLKRFTRRTFARLFGS